MTIKVTAVAEYDAEDARKWCSECLPRAMVLDTKYFEKHAKAVAETAPLEFVEIVDALQVAIASDLSAWLPPKTDEP